MAGIGFQLKKLFRHEGLMMNVRAYAYSSFVIVGPMLFCMAMVIFIQLILKWYAAPLEDREIFVAVAQYSFVFSQLLTSGFIMILYRFIADMIYLRKWDYILPSLQGVLTLNLLLGGLLGVVFYLHSPLVWSQKVSAYLLFVELVMIWLQTVYLTALKDYMRIVKSFLFGFLVCIGCSFIFLQFLNLNKASSVLFAMDIGFFWMILSFASQISLYFRSNNRKYFYFLTYLDKYPGLFFIGFFYTLGLYIHNFIYWGSSFQFTIGETFYLAPFYDVPVFYALMSITPAMVVFVVSVETEFYTTYKNYYTVILNGGTIGEIQKSKQEMHHVLMQQMGRVVEVQLFFSITSIMLGIYFYPRLGLIKDQLDTFYLLVFGAYFCIIMYIVTLILLYFDDRKGVLGVVALFMSSNFILTLLLVESYSHGFSFFLSSLIGLLVSLARLYYLLKNIDYYTFCAQPIVAREEKAGRWGRSIERLENWEREILKVNGGTQGADKN